MRLRKAVSIAIEEFRLAVQKAADDSELPACVLEPIVYSMHQKLAQLSTMELQRDLEKSKGGEQDGDTK